MKEVHAIIHLDFRFGWDLWMQYLGPLCVLRYWFLIQDTPSLLFLCYTTDVLALATFIDCLLKSLLLILVLFFVILLLNQDLLELLERDTEWSRVTFLTSCIFLGVNERLPHRWLSCHVYTLGPLLCSHAEYRRL